MRQLFNLNDVRMRDKMLILYIFCVFLPIVLTNVLFYQATVNNVKNQRTKDIMRAVEQIKNQFRAEIEDAVSVSMVFYNDILLNEMLEQDYPSPAAYVAAYDNYLRRILNNYTPVYNGVQSIKIYVNNPTMLHSGGIAYISDQVKQSNWYQAISGLHSTRVVLIRTSREDNHDLNRGTLQDTLSIVSRMNNFPVYSRWEKIVKIDIKGLTIHQIFSNLNVNGHVYLLNDEGNIEYTTDPSVRWLEQKVNFSSLPLNQREIVIESEYSNASYLNGWRIVGKISEEEVLREVRNSREFIIVLTAINIVIPTLIIIWITRSFNTRLVNIVRHMKKVKNQYFDTIQYGESRDEIGQLTREFNRMTQQIRSLIDDVYIADIQRKSLELERRQAQLNALQSQINPHFLFNALETIRMRSIIKNETETARIIHNMAKIFRTSLTWNRDRITVEEEMAFIDCFLEIQKYRFEDRLTYNIHIDPEARSYVIPKMMFLPFVENASIHGIEPLRHGGTIDIRIELSDGDLMFSIRDNGVGMNQEQVDKIYGYIQNEVEIGDRIGMQNVIYRLKLLYGSRFDLQIDSAPGEGTHIVLRIFSELADEFPIN